MMPKRLRRHGVKQSKTGCHTCKSRKVKCDEKRPVCDKCAKGDRPCNSWPASIDSRTQRFDPTRLSVQTDGQPSIPLTPITMNSSPSQTATTLGTPPHWASYSSPLPPRRSSPVLEDDGLLRRAQQIVLHSCVDDFPFFNGILSVAFFQYDILCSSTKYAAAAFEAAAEHITKVNPSHRTPIAANICHLYQTAVSLSSQELSSPHALRSSTPTTCLFLMCTGLLLRRIPVAMLHLDALIKGYGPQLCQRMPSLYADIDSLLRSLDIHKMTSSDRVVANAVPPIPIDTVSLPPADIRFLGRHVVEIVHASYCFINSAADNIGMGRPAPLFGAKQSLHLNAVSRVQFVIARMLSKPLSNSDIMHLLRLQSICLSVHIELTNLPQTTESSFDACSQQFEAIITNAERILAYRQSVDQDAGPVFSLQLGIVQPLYLAAMKYRHRSWRRKAIDLLDKAGQDGPWRGSILAAVARRCLEIEEAQTSTFSPYPNNALGYQPDSLAFYQNYLDSHAAQEPTSVPDAGRITACRFVEDNRVAELAWDNSPAFTNSPVSLTETKVVFIRRRGAVCALASRTIPNDSSVNTVTSDDWQTWTEQIFF